MISKPQPNEYNSPLPGRYINLIKDDEDVISILDQQGQAVYDLFYALTDEQAMFAYAPEKWTLKQVLGHMVDTERIFGFRAFCFSREQQELPGFDQDIYVMRTNFNEQSIQQLAEEFRAVRLANLYLYRSVTPEQETRTGIASGYEISVRAIIYAAAGHVRYHQNLLRERYQLG